MTARAGTPKYQQVYASLQRELRSGRYKHGDRLPSEAELVERYGASRITIGRAMRELQEAGLIERRAGSGTFMKEPQASGGCSFGLLIPDLGETEIFEPICQGMTIAREHALLWGSSHGAETSKEEWALRLCRQYIARGVSGVFFAPLERTPNKDAVNRKIADALDAASIPIVLLDRTVVPYPERGHHDLVGIDNRRAGYVVTEHLLRRGHRRIAFVTRQHAAPTVDAREAGYREALFAARAPVERSLVHRLSPEAASEVETMMKAARPEAIVCANDRTAGQLMHTLLQLGFSIPRDVALAGIDDVEYARLLPIPLTTLRQPTRAIGEAAMEAMLGRVERRDRPTRDILLSCELVVRQSCG